MAKRKKLNRRLILILASVLVVILLGTGALGWKYRRQLFPKDPEKYARLGDEARARGDYREAEKCYVTARYYSKDLRHYHKLAEFQFDWWKDPTGLSETERRARFGSARKVLQDALLLDPDHEDCLRLLCEMEWLRANVARRWEEYIEPATRLLQLEKEDHLTHFRLGVAKGSLAQTDYNYADQAEESFRTAITLKPDEIDYWIGLARFQILVRRNSEQARQAFEEAIQANPDNASLRISYASFLRLSDKEKCLQQIKEAIRAEPDNPLGRMTLAEYHLQENKADDAIEELKLARKLEATDDRIYALLAIAYTRKKQPEQAASALREGLDAINQRLNAEATTQPAEQRGLEQHKLRLLVILAESLLDMVDEGHPNSDPLLDEARACSEQISELTAKLNEIAANEAKIAGRIASADGDLARARDLLEKAYEIFGTSDPKTATALIRVYTKQNLHGLAEGVVDAFLSVPANRDHPLLLYYKAQYEMKRRNFEEARRYLARALRGEPDNENIQKLKAQLDVQGALDRAGHLWIDEQAGEAIRQVEQLHLKFPGNRNIFTELLGMYISSRQYDKAKVIVRRALKEWPQDEALQRQLELLERPEGEQFDLRMKMADQTTDPLERALEKASVCRIGGKNDLLLKYLKEAAEINPSDLRVVQGIIEYAIAQRDWKLGEQWVERSRKDNVDSVGGHFHAARLAAVRGNHSEAIASLTEALKRQPEMRIARTLLGQCYVKTRELSKAEEQFRILATNDPSFAFGAIGMAQVTELLGKLAEHAEWVEKAYRLAPNHAYVREAYLGLEELKADPEKIIPRRERILRENPGNLRNRINLAKLYERAKRLGDAEEQYRIIHQNPSNRLLGAQLLVDFYMKIGRLSEANDVLTGLIGRAETPDEKVTAWLGYAQFLALRDPANAELAFQKALREGPEDPRVHLEYARFLASRNRWPEAAAAMEKYNVLSPSDPSAERNLVRYLIQADQLKQAVLRLDRILADDPTDAEALTLKAILASAQGNFDNAMELLNRAVRVGPGYHEALLYRARLLLAMGQLSSAEEDLRNFWQQDGSAGAGTELARFYATLGDFSKAERAYREILAKREDYTDAVDGLIELYAQQKDWQRLEKELDEARKTFPDNPKYLLVSGRMWEQRGEQGQALASYEAAAKMAPSMSITLRSYWLALVDAGQHEKALALSGGYENRPDYITWVGPIRGRAMAKANKIPEADAAFAASLKAANGLPELNFIMQQAAEAYGSKAATEKFASWIAEHRPGDSAAYVALGAQHGVDGEFPEAERAFAKALELAKTPAEKLLASKRLGTAHYQTRKFDQAEKAYLAALAISPTDGYAANNLAYLYVEDLNQPEKARKLARDAVMRAPGNARVLDTYGWTLAKLREFGEAEKYLRLSVQIDGSLAPNLYHLGWVCEQTGRLSDAQDSYQRAMDLIKDRKDDPLYQSVQDALERVRAK